MKTINRLQYFFLSLLVTGCILTGCKADTEPWNIGPTLTVHLASRPDSVSRTEVIVSGSLRRNNNQAKTLQFGLEYAENSAFTEEGNPVKVLIPDAARLVSGSDFGGNNEIQFSNLKIVNLSPDKLYFVRLFVVADSVNITDLNTAYSNTISFRTSRTSPPSFSTINFTNTTPNSITVSATITDVGMDLGTNITEAEKYTSLIVRNGFVYKEVPAGRDELREDELEIGPGVETRYTTVQSDGRIDTVLNNLRPGHRYAVRSFARNKNRDEGYSSIQYFETTPSTSPTISNVTASYVGTNSISVAAEILGKGNSSNVTLCGFVYSRDRESSLVMNTSGVEFKAVPYSGNDKIETSLSNLLSGETYYIRAVVMNDSGTGYSSETLSVTTGTNDDPVVTVPEMLSVTGSEIRVSAELLRTGSGSVVERGFVYSDRVQMPLLEGSNKIAAEESFEVTIGNLIAGTTYYIRAYAKNSTNNIGYSPQAIEVTTIRDVQAPTVRTISVSLTNIGDESAENMAQMYGFLTSNGGSPIEMVGFELSREQNMHNAERFEAQLDNDNMFGAVSYQLEPNTTYYVRAFATNAVGTSYGEIKSFTTPDPSNSVPRVLTEVPIPASTSAELIGIVENNGSSAIRNLGFEVSTENTMANATIYPGSFDDNNRVQFHTSAGNLQPSTTYYVRAYAVNDAGTGYGETVSFTTLEPETVTPGEGDNPYPSQGGVKGQRKAKATTKR